jgi:hypothetical protein
MGRNKDSGYSKTTNLGAQEDPLMAWAMLEPLKEIASAQAGKIRSVSRLIDTRKVSDESIDRAMARGSVDVARAAELVNVFGTTGIADGTADKALRLARESRLAAPQVAPAKGRRRKK